MKRAVSLCLLVALIGCATADQVAKKAEITAIDLQEAAAHAYLDATQQETVADAACGSAMKIAGIPAQKVTPASWPAIAEACKTLGTPIPYDPFKLAAVGRQVNQAYDAIQAADVARMDVKKAIAAGKAPDTSGVVIAAMQAIRSLYTVALDVGLKVDFGKADAFVQAVLK